LPLGLGKTKLKIFHSDRQKVVLFDRWEPTNGLIKSTLKSPMNTSSQLVLLRKAERLEKEITKTPKEVSGFR